MIHGFSVTGGFIMATEKSERISLLAVKDKKFWYFLRLSSWFQLIGDYEFWPIILSGSLRIVDFLYSLYLFINYFVDPLQIKTEHFSKQIKNTYLS